MRSPTGSPSFDQFMMRSLSSAPSSSARHTGGVTSESEFCSEISDSFGLRSTLVLYAGAYAGGCDVVSRIRNSASRSGARFISSLLPLRISFVSFSFVSFSFVPSASFLQPPGDGRRQHLLCLAAHEGADMA